MSLETARCRGEAESEAHPGRRFDDRQRTVLPDPASRHVRSWRESSSIEDVRSKERLGSDQDKEKIPTSNHRLRAGAVIESWESDRRLAGAKERRYDVPAN